MPTLNLPPHNPLANLDSIVRALLIDRLYPAGKAIDVDRLSEILGVTPRVIYYDARRLEKARELAAGAKEKIAGIKRPRKRKRHDKPRVRKWIRKVPPKFIEPRPKNDRMD